MNIDSWNAGCRNYLNWCRNTCNLYGMLPEVVAVWMKACAAMAGTRRFSCAPPRSHHERRDISRRTYGV